MTKASRSHGVQAELHPVLCIPSGKETLFPQLDMLPRKKFKPSASCIYVLQNWWSNIFLLKSYSTSPPPSSEPSFSLSLKKSTSCFSFVLVSIFFLHLQLISYFKEKQKSLWFSRLPKFNIFSRNSGSVFPKNKSKHLSDIISSLLTLIKISVLHPVWAPSSPCGKLSINFIHFKQ